MVRLIVAVIAVGALGQAMPPALERFVEATSTDGRIATSALDRIGAGWKDSYAAMIVDMTRLMQPPRRNAQETAEPPLTFDDERGALSLERSRNDAPVLASRGSPIRRRLLSFLEKQTGRRFGTICMRGASGCGSCPMIRIPSTPRSKD